MTKLKVLEEKTFEEAVSLTGFGKFNIFILLATGGCLMSVIVETMSAMFVTPAGKCELNLNLTEIGLLYSMSFFGVVFSSHLWGYLADTKGRKPVTIISLICSTIISVVGCFVSIKWLFILLRFFNGFFLSVLTLYSIGGASAIIYAFAGEFHNNRFRPKVVSWIATFVAFGNIFLPGMAWMILPQTWSLEIPFLDSSFRPWRFLMIIYAVPSLVSALLVCFLPESPKYLMSRGKHEEALKILKNMFKSNTGKSDEEYPVKSIIWEDQHTVHHSDNEGILKSMWEQTVPLFRRDCIFKTVMVSYLQFAIFFTTSAVMMWYPQILNNMSELGKMFPDDEITMCKAMRSTTLNNAENSTTECTGNVNEEVFLVSLVIGLGYVVSYVSVGTVINLVGPRRLLVGFITITTAAGVAAQLLSSYTYIEISLGIFVMAATGVGIVNAIVVDLYPTEVRGMALAVSLMFGRFGAMAGSNVAGHIFSHFCDYLFYILATLHALVIIIILLLPSTKSSEKAVKETKEV